MLALIKGVFSDILILYKNFIHFVFSKILIYLATFIITFLLVIPFLILGWILFHFFGSNFNIATISYFWIFVLLLLALLALFFFLLGYSYNNVLFSNLNLNYIKNKKLRYSKNYYFSAKLFYSYAKVFSLNFLILLSPIVFVTIGFFLITAFAGIENYSDISDVSPYSISLLILIIIGFLAFIYLTYKTAFSYIILINESKGTKFKKAFNYIKKSFKLTKGFNTASKLASVVLLVFTITLPIILPKDHYDTEKTRVSDYILFTEGKKELTQRNTYYFEDLKLDYNSFNQSDLKNLKNNKNNIYLLFWLLNFLIINGILNMTLVSFYKRHLLMK